MSSCFISSTSENIVSIIPIVRSEFDKWLQAQNERTKNFIRSAMFAPKLNFYSLMTDEKGLPEKVFLCVDRYEDFWAFAAVPPLLPPAIYNIEMPASDHVLEQAALAFGLGCYQFTLYKKQIPIEAKLLLPPKSNKPLLENLVQSIYWVRDLINTPTEDMGPAELGEAAVTLGEKYGAKVKQIIGDNLLKEGYPTIHAVGRASDHAPRLIDLRWGNNQHPKITLVGKGVCFDSGGLDIKTADGMLLMKKDMAGAAHTLGLARLIMAMAIPVSLRVLIPAVENMVSGDSYCPGDVLTTRKGLTVEITNTDAEGRLVLCDALAEASTEKPELLIDFATLTGAASIALGPEIPGFFTSNETLAHDFMQSAKEQNDPLWRMPLYDPYRFYLESPIADLCNASQGRYAGMITAALFLKAFVAPEISWAHFDMMAWNPERKLGRAQGAEVMGLRAVFYYLQKKFN